MIDFSICENFENLINILSKLNKLLAIEDNPIFSFITRSLRDPLIFAKNFLVKKNIFKKEKLDSLDKNIFKNVNVDFSHMLNFKKPKFNRIKNLVYKK